MINIPLELPKERTYIVLGAPRGGTSMVAGSLRLSDVHMGDTLNLDNNEDLEFVTHNGEHHLFDDDGRRAEYLERTRQLIAARNEAHDVWGWKDPLAIRYLPELIDSIRNPFIVMVYRDMAAVAMRERVELPPEEEEYVGDRFMLNKLTESAKYYTDIVSLVRSGEYPTLAVSYERTLRYSDDFARMIRSFAGKERSIGDASELEAQNKIVAFVRPDAITGRIGVSVRDVSKVFGQTHGGRSPFLSSLNSLSDGYDRVARKLNESHFEEALSMIEELLPLRLSAFRSAPHLAASPVVAMDAELGLLYMKTVALINLHEGHEAFVTLSEYFSRFTVLKSFSKSCPIGHSLFIVASELRTRLSKDLFGVEAEAASA